MKLEIKDQKNLSELNENSIVLKKISLKVKSAFSDPIIKLHIKYEDYNETKRIYLDILDDISLKYSNCLEYKIQNHPVICCATSILEICNQKDKIFIIDYESI